MRNSPEICRRHYAALIPEEMHDTVEFTKPAANKDNARDATQELIEEILRQVDRIGKVGGTHTCVMKPVADRSFADIPQDKGPPNARP
jgi:hypothetical protein